MDDGDEETVVGASILRIVVEEDSPVRVLGLHEGDHLTLGEGRVARLVADGEWIDECTLQVQFVECTAAERRELNSDLLQGDVFVTDPIGDSSEVAPGARWSAPSLEMVEQVVVRSCIVCGLERGVPIQWYAGVPPLPLPWTLEPWVPGSETCTPCSRCNQMRGWA